MRTSTLISLLASAIPLRAALTDFASGMRPLLEQYCFDCHGDEADPKGGMNLERFRSLEDTLRDRGPWAAVLEKVESLQMPPPKDKSQPTAGERARLVAWIRELAAAPDPVLGAPDPGKPVLRRLTRLEYNNSIRDLFALEHDLFMFPERLPVNGSYFTGGLPKMPEPLSIFVREYGLKYPVLLPDAGLPGDNRAEHGYSNRGDAMNLSPLLLEKYLETARAIVQSPKLGRQSDVFRALAGDPAAPPFELTPPADDAAEIAYQAADSFAPNLNLPRQAKDGGAATVTYQFRFNANTAAQEGTGGVWQAEDRDRIVPPEAPISIAFGPLNRKRLRVTSPQALWVAGFSTAEETSGEGLFTNQVPGEKVLALRFAVAGAPGEVITDLAVSVLGRRGEKGPVHLTVTFTGGGTNTLRDVIPAGEGVGNTFYSFRAPDGEGIAALHVDGSGFSGNHVLLDDLGFITNGGSGDPLAPAGKAARLPAREKRGIARTRLEAFLSRLFRHPVHEDIMARYMGLYDAATRAGASFPDAIREVLAAAMASPEFLYLTGPREIAAPVRALDPFELATRMAYFLWASPPDDTLLAAALDGTLQAPHGIAAQVQRMIGDRRVKELAESFAVQWLRLDQLYTAKPDPKLFPAFYYGQNGKRTLHAPMLVEALLLFETVLVEDRSIMDFIDPGYTWVNLKLVKHYGLEAHCAPRIKELNLRMNSSDDLKDQRMNNIWWRTKLPDKTRGGYLTMAGPLTVTSLPVRTSPVKRGAWLLESIFNRPPQEPKIAFVLKEADRPADETQSVRQRFEAHRNQPACYSCHVRLDPPGFALEAFDPVGSLRRTDAGQPVDASGTWHDIAFDGPAAFKAAVVAHRSEFIRGFIEHLLSYALGRKLELFDLPAVEEIERRTAANGYRLSHILTAIVESYPFRHTRTQ